MAVQRCPECGGRLHTNYCDICMRRVPFAGPRPRKYRDPWDASSAHREEAGHECVTFDAPRSTVPKQPFPKPKTKGQSKTKNATIVAVILVLLSFLPTFFAVVEDAIDSVAEPVPVPEYNAEAFLVGEELPTLEPLGIYSDGEITITAETLGTYYDDPALSILIENNSDRDIDVQLENVVVNSYSLNSFLSAQLMAGQVSQAFIPLYTTELERMGIENIAAVDLRLRIYDMDDYSEIAYVEQVTLETDLADSYRQTVDYSGLSLYSDDSVNVVLRDLTLWEYGSGEIEVFLENNSGTDAMFTIDGVLLNGQQAQGTLCYRLMPGTRTINSVYLYDLEDLEISDLEQIEEITLDLQIDYMDGWEYLETHTERISFEPAAIA